MLLHCENSAGGRSKNLGGQHYKTLIGLSVWSTPTILNLGKSGGATAPLAPPVPPALGCIIILIISFSKRPKSRTNSLPAEGTLP